MRVKSPECKTRTFQSLSTMQEDDDFDMDLPLTKTDSLRRRKSSHVNYTHEFQYLVTLAKKHYLSIAEVRRKRDEYKTLGVDGDGTVPMEVFLNMIRQLGNVEPDEPIPPQLLSTSLSTVGKERIDFEDYIVWSLSTAYAEDMLVDPTEKQMRQISRSTGIPLPDVERIKRVFDKFDTDGSGTIDEFEFGNVIATLEKVPNGLDISKPQLRRLWREVDTDFNREINFTEFLVWYMRENG